MLEFMPVLIGYLAAAFLAAALLINQTIRFRWVSMMGSFTFVVYGVLIHAFPIIVTNVILLCINIYKLVRLYNMKELFEFMEIRKEFEIVKRFLNFYEKDIQNFFPDFKFDSDEGKVCFIVLRDLVIANIFIAKINSDGSINVEINYTVPKYRDYKVGKFIFEKRKHFLVSKGINKIVYDSVFSSQHAQFLKRVGFSTTQVSGTLSYVKEL